MKTATSCHLHFTLGRVEPCPGTACPFWERDGCALELLGTELERPDLARYLLGLRGRLEQAKDTSEQAGALAAFAELLPPEYAPLGNHTP
jgi:hypothetical protein